MTSIRIERSYAHPPSRVWRALTERESISEWLMKTDDFEPRVGARFVLRAKPQPGWRGFVECEVVECESERVLAYTWVGDERRAPMLVRFALSPEGDGTKLSFEHSGFTGLGGWFLARLMMGPGWKKMFDRRLPAILDREAPRPAGAPAASL
ncbi:MAG: SRPBCC domain-containing protein [Sandaracinaceae bacterium]